MQSPLEPGSVLSDRYRVERLLGRGGMGAVYLAHDNRFDRRFAIKQSFFSDNSYGRAFEREARLLNELRHPQLPVVVDFFTQGGTAFLVMDFVEGEDLAAVIANRSRDVTIAQSIEWALAVLDALRYLHAHEPPIVHRDIKPQNLKVTPDGSIRLLDFGLARGRTGTDERTAGTSLAGYTPNFAPPEQITATTADPRSDLYSLGATLYCLLARTVPPDAVERATALAAGRPDPLRSLDAVNPAVSSALASVIHRAMALDVDDRPASATVLRDMLTGAMSDTVVAPLAPTAVVLPHATVVVAPRETVPQTKARPKGRGLFLMSTILAVLVLGIGILAIAAVGVVGWRAGWFSRGAEPSTSSPALPTTQAASPADLEGTWVMKLVSTEGRMTTSVGDIEIPPEKLVELIGITNRDTLRWQVSFRSGEGTIVETYASGREATIWKGTWNGQALVIDTSTAERRSRREISIRDGALVGLCSLRTEKLEVSFTVQGTREGRVGSGPAEPSVPLRPTEPAR